MSSNTCSKSVIKLIEYLEEVIDLNLEQLRYFKVLAGEENIPKAASKLYISPPALHASISRIEKYVGHPLFEKRGRHIFLTGYGKIMYKYVCEFIESSEQLQTEMLAYSTKANDVIRVGVSALTLWQEPLVKFMDKHPEIKLAHSSLKNEQLADETVIGKFDFLITDLHDINSDFWERSVLIAEDKAVAMVWPGHHLEKRKVVNADDLKNEAFIALSKGYSSRKYFDQVIKFLGIEPTIYTESDYSLRTALVKAHKGIALSTVYGAAAPMLTGLVPIPIGSGVFPRIQTLFWKKNAKLTPQQTVFQNFLIDFFKLYKGNIK